MSQIHFIGGEKGGVGKSVLSRLLAQYHIDKGLPFRAFDTDRSHGALLRFYGNYSVPIVLDEFASADQLMEAAMERRQAVLVDLASQTSAPLFNWMDENDLPGLAAEEGIGLSMWHLLDDGADGIDLLERLFDRFGTNVGYVVVKNFGRGKDFSTFEASSAKATADRLGTPIIELPELHGPTMRKVDHGNLSFWAAGNNKQAGLGLMDRQRVKVWIRKAFEQIDTLGETVISRRSIAPASAETDSADSTT
ncbi:MAG: mobilization protein [Chromatiaceae bacterium]|jgi:hypothetical protein|nr:mobilization protein [Chromatiaceae bacterium]